VVWALPRSSGRMSHKLLTTGATTSGSAQISALATAMRQSGARPSLVRRTRPTTTQTSTLRCVSAMLQRMATT
jgi:hypothetical protein